MQDKDHWKKETAARVRDTKERMQKLTENQLETLTKRTILENEQMDAEMRYQSRQVGLDGRDGGMAFCSRSWETRGWRHEQGRGATRACGCSRTLLDELVWLVKSSVLLRI